jgi:DNA-binding winged helix-turn-helix (wHTH) protein
MDEDAKADILLFGGFCFDRSRGRLSRQNEDGGLVPVAIGSRAIEVLGLLIDRRGDLVSKDEIMDAVWPGVVVEGANVTVQISVLRRVLDDGRSDGSLIQTIPGRGYRFVAPVVRAEHVTPATPAAEDGTGATGRRAPCRADDDILPSEPVADPWVARILPAGSRRRLGVFAAMTSAAAALLFGTMGISAVRAHAGRILDRRTAIRDAGFVPRHGHFGVAHQKADRAAVGGTRRLAVDGC